MANSAPISDTAARARTLYAERIRREVEPDRVGEFLVMNLDTGEYEIDPDDLAASKRARARFPDAPLFKMRVGHPTAYRLGGRFTVGRE